MDNNSSCQPLSITGSSVLLGPTLGQLLVYVRASIFFKSTGLVWAETKKGWLFGAEKIPPSLSH